MVCLVNVSQYRLIGLRVIGLVLRRAPDGEAQCWMKCGRKAGLNAHPGSFSERGQKAFWIRRPYASGCARKRSIGSCKLSKIVENVFPAAQTQ